MNPELWNRVKEAVIAFEDCDVASQKSFLESLKQSDPECYKHALPLIEVEEDSLGFLGKPLFHLDSELETSRELEPGATLGNYQLTDRLGSGGMGTVFKANGLSEAAYSVAAIKVLKHGLDTEEIKHRFQKERKILSFLDHPNIAKLFDYGTTQQGQPYLVMEYIEGEHITDYCDRMRLSVKERLKIFQKICASVQYAHQNLIIHRDLKPANILVTPGGEPKLLDFGIAKLIETDSSDTAVTQTILKLRPMTPDYASPEQIKGAPTDTTCDLYALGVVLFELLTGRRPYTLEGMTEQERIQCISEFVPEKPSTVVLQYSLVPKGTEQGPTPESIAKARGSEPRRLARTLRGDLDTIVAKALRKEPERRYASAEQLSGDIERHLRGFPLQARRDNPFYTAKKFIRRHGVLVSSVLGLLLLLTGFSITLARSNARLKRTQNISEEERQHHVLMADTFQRIIELAGSRDVHQDDVIQQALAQMRERFESRELNRREKASESLALGMGYAAIEDTAAAAAMLEKSMGLHEQAFHRQGRAYPQSMLMLSTFYLKTQQFQKARELLHKTLLLLEETRGTEAWEVGRVCSMLGQAFDGLGALSEAQTWFERAITIVERHKKEQFATWTSIQNAYAHHRSLQGHVDKATELYETVVQEKQAVYGPNDFDLVHSIRPMAELYLKQHAYSQARSWLERARNIHIASQALQHPDYQNLLTQLLTTYHAIPDVAMSEAIAREGLLLSQKAPRKEVFWLMELAKTLENQQRYMEAEAHLRLAIERCEWVPHEMVVSVYLALAKTLRHMGDLGEAAFILDEAEDLLPGSRGSGSAVEAAYLRELAAQLLEQGSLDSANNVAKEALAIDEADLEKIPLSLADNYFLLAQIAFEAKNYSKAKAAVVASLHIRQHEWGSESHPQVEQVKDLMRKVLAFTEPPTMAAEKE